MVLLSGSAAGAREVSLPVRLDLAFVRQALVAQIYNQPGEKAAILDDGVGCTWLNLYEPEVSATTGLLRIMSRGSARIGTRIAGQCLVALEWSGFVEILEEAELKAPAHVVTFKVIDSNIYDEKKEKRLTTGKLWDLMKEYVHPRLAALQLDLAQPLNELRAWLPLLLPGSEDRIERLLASLAVRDPRVVGEGVAVTLAFEIEPRPAATAPPEPTLSAAELQRWQSKWQQWDAFLTFVVKQFARDAGGDLRRAVLDVLLEARYELLDALLPPEAGAPDPVPGLFLRSWERLAPVLRREAAGLPAETALAYTSFIAAGDALAALNELGPDFGVEISADGLRRLARMVAPASIEDPVSYSTDLDPNLRDLLGLGAPLPPPQVGDEVELDLSSLQPRPLFGLTVLSDWFVATAWAGIDSETLRRLNRWAPTRTDVDSYLPLVRDLLRDVGGETLAKSDLPATYEPMYQLLVLATAWQESCWRQYIRQGGKLVPLKSTVGSVGIMQVNQHVWRGVYDLKGLLADIAYNGRAGSEILLHYFKDYAIAKGEHEKPGGLDNLARATYAVYNGGPGHLARYRAKNPKKSLKKIDDLFWEKYSAVRAGGEMEVVRCYSGN